MGDWAVFLDRDGVINEEIEYLSHPDQLQLIPGAAEAIHLLNSMHIPVIVVTNQSAVARGYIPEERVEEIHRTLSTMLAQEDAHVDRFYYCPHHPTEGLGAYLMDCGCRKPQPGLLRQAARDFDLDLSRCYIVGDKVSDLGAGEAVKCHTILVRTGYGAEVWESWAEAFEPEHVAEDLHDAVRWILSRTADSAC